MVKILLWIILCLGMLPCCNTGAIEKRTFDKTSQPYLDDFNELVDSLTTYHPALYEFTVKEKFDFKVSELRSQINKTITKRDLLWKLAEVIALLGCSHTNLGFLGNYSKLVNIEEYFPLQARLINNEFIVVDPLINEDRIQSGDVIKAINDKPIEEIITDIYAHIHGQAHITRGKKGMLNAFQDLYIPYALNFPNLYIVELDGRESVIELMPVKGQPSYPPMINPNSPCQDDFCLNELSPETALLTLRTFEYYGDRTPLFINFLDETFKRIKDKSYSNLIIDLRGNLGGASHIAKHLLQYTLDEPFRYYSKSDFGGTEFLNSFKDNFKGEVVVLINGDGFSSVGQLASIYKDKERGVFIGETLGSNQFCTANQKRFQLANTKFNYTVARNVFLTDVKETNTKALIKPDYFVEQSVADYIAGKDVVLAKAIEILSQE